jgi:hypothetical protein
MKTCLPADPGRRAFLAGAASSGALLALGPLRLVGATAGTEKVPSFLLPPNFTNLQNSPIDALLRDIPLPRLVPIETKFERPVLTDVAQTLREKLQTTGVLASIRPGMKIAVGAGSRGITNLPLVTRTLLDALKKAGAEPFVFPAMGSHGGATPAGQLGVLKRMGFTEESMGVPFRATMDVVQVGTTPDGLPAYVDAIAAKADGIIVVNRIKPHTSFRGSIESGLVKMTVIGVGKQKGAETCHNLGYGRMEHNLLALARTTLATGKILFGVGLIENGYHETCQLEVVPAREIVAREPKLLAEARRLLPTVPISPLDVLIIDELGKNISGSGFDPNVVGRYATSDVKRTPKDPQITRIAVLDVTAASDGNATGLGNADFTTERVFRKFNFIETYCNLLTSTTTMSGKIPMVMRNDRQAIQAAIKTCLIGDPRQVRLARIRNTLSLDRILISENLAREAAANPAITVTAPAAAMAFDADGNSA